LTCPSWNPAISSHHVMPASARDEDLYYYYHACWSRYPHPPCEGCVHYDNEMISWALLHSAYRGWQKFTHVLEEYTASIFRVDEYPKAEAVHASKMLVNFYQTTQHQIREDSAPQTERCLKHKYCSKIFSCYKYKNSEVHQSNKTLLTLWWLRNDLRCSMWVWHKKELLSYHWFCFTWVNRQNILNLFFLLTDLPLRFLVSSFLSTSYLLGPDWTILLLVIPYIPFLQILILMHFSVSLFCPFFLQGQTGKAVPVLN
jgi:hypothetical protein